MLRIITLYKKLKIYKNERRLHWNYEINQSKTKMHFTIAFGAFFAPPYFIFNNVS